MGLGVCSTVWRGGGGGGREEYRNGQGILKGCNNWRMPIWLPHCFIIIEIIQNN